MIVDYSIQYFWTDCGDAEVEPSRIPNELLAYADPDAESVREYRGVSPSTTQQNRLSLPKNDA